MQVFGKFLQRYTPDLVVKQVEEIALEELEDKDDQFDIREAQLLDIRQNQDGDDEVKGKDGAAGRTKHDDKHRDDGRNQLARSHKDDSSQKGGSHKPPGSPKANKTDVDEVIETGLVGEGHPEELKLAAAGSRGGAPELKALSEHQSNTHKDPTDSKGELQREGDKEMDEEERQRRQEEEELTKAVYAKLLEIKPTIKSLKKYHITSLGNSYELCLHPEPIFKRHCLLTKNGRLKYDVPLVAYRSYEDKADKRIRISDFSQVHKLRTDETNAKYRKEEISKIQSTTLNSRFLDFEELFTLLDLNVISNLIESLDCFVFYRILPKETPEEILAQENKLYVNQCVHVVRRQDLLDEMNEAAAGFTAFDSLDLDSVINAGRGLISDLAIEQLHQAEVDKINRREAKAKRIEEQKARREERQRILTEKMEEERRIAEEWAQKEKEASRNPAKAAALKIEREKFEQERLAKAKAAQEKETQGASNPPENPAIEGNAEMLESQQSLPDSPEKGEGN